MPITNSELLSLNEIHELVQKSVIVTSLGGQLSDQQREDFINLIIDQTPILQSLYVEQDIESKLTIDGLEFGQPVIVAGEEGVAPSNDDITTPDMPRLTINPTEIIAAIDISYNFLRKNIRRKNAEEDMNRALAKRIGMDLVDLIFNGDTALDSSTRLNKARRILDGILKKANADADVNDFVVEASPTYVGANSEFGKGLKAIPKQYRDDRSSLAHFCCVDALDDYEDEIGARPTAAADNILFGSNKVMMHKRVEILTPFGFPDNTILTSVKNNIVVGFGRKMEVLTQAQHRARKLEITVVTDMDCGFIYGEAMALGKQI